VSLRRAAGALLTNLLLAAASTVTGVLVAEGAVRWLGVEPVYRSTEGVSAGFRGSIRAGWYVRDHRLGFAPGPRWESETGRRGFQNGAEYPDADSDATDIVLLGDSVIESRLLEAALKRILADAPVRIWNAGIGGYNTLQEAYYLEDRTDVTPAFVVVGFCLNDFLPSMTVVRDQGQKAMMQNLFEPIGQVHPFWFRHSALYRMITLRFLRPQGAGSLWSAESVARNRGMVAEGLQRIRRWADAHGSTLLVVVYPHLTDDDDYLRAAHETALQLLAELDIAAIDLKAVYDARGYQLAQLRLTPDDIVHPNAEGHRIAANEVVRRLAPRLGIADVDAERITADATSPPP
jgi:lysophospholipase L1-like esterase